MNFTNIQLQHLNEVEQLTSNGMEIYENPYGAIFVNHNSEICLSDFIGAYVDYHDYIVLKDWNQFCYGEDFEIIKVLF